MKSENNTQEDFMIKKKRGVTDFTRRELFVFIVQIVGVLSVIFLIVGTIGFFPKEWSLGPSKNVEITKEEELIGIQNDLNIVGERPTRVIIPKVGVDSNIEHPLDPNINSLDIALQNGAVHYPGSGTVNRGNIFLFGHSTNWKVVQNKAYQTFNGVEELVSGDEIILETEGQSIIYIVSNVSLVDEDQALVEIGGDQRKLTISTCNSFGEKQERWVVEAYPQV